MVSYIAEKPGIFQRGVAYSQVRNKVTLAVELAPFKCAILSSDRRPFNTGHVDIVGEDCVLITPAPVYTVGKPQQFAGGAYLIYAVILRRLLRINSLAYRACCRAQMIVILSSTVYHFIAAAIADYSVCCGEKINRYVFVVGYHLSPYVTISLVGKILIHQVSDLAAFKILCGHCGAVDTGQGFLFFCKAVVAVQLCIAFTTDVADELTCLSCAFGSLQFDVVSEATCHTVEFYAVYVDIRARDSANVFCPLEIAVNNANAFYPRSALRFSEQTRIIPAVNIQTGNRMTVAVENAVEIISFRADRCPLYRISYLNVSACVQKIFIENYVVHDGGCYSLIFFVDQFCQSEKLVVVGYFILGSVSIVFWNVIIRIPRNSAAVVAVDLVCAIMVVIAVFRGINHILGVAESGAFINAKVLHPAVGITVLFGFIAFQVQLPRKFAGSHLIFCKGDYSFIRFVGSCLSLFAAFAVRNSILRIEQVTLRGKI